MRTDLLDRDDENSLSRPHMSENSPSFSPPGKTAGVRKRHVFYLSGFDPRGPSHYHALYTTESKRQAALNGLDLTVGKRRRIGKLVNAWKISSVHTETEYEFLRWDDIIRAHWPKNEVSLFRAAVPVYWVVLIENLIGKLLKIAWPSALTVSYPIVAFLGSLIIGVLLAAGMIAGAIMLGFSWWTGVIPGAAVFAFGVWLGRWQDNAFRSYWLLRTYGLMQPWAYGKRPVVDERIRVFAAYILEKLRESDADEVLLVGHSAGSVLTVQMVAEMLQLDPALGMRGQDFTLVSLGNCIPILSMLSGSKRLRSDLATVATAPGVGWLDFSAKRDGASLTQVDPLKASGISRPVGIPVRPLQFPVRIVKMFAPEDYAAIKRDIFRVHFQYIMASDILTDYDFFAITAGPVSLAERYPETSTSPNS